MSDKRLNPLLLLPLAVSLGLGVLAYVALQRDTPNALPSALAGRTAPDMDLPALTEGQKGPSTADLTAPGVKLVNFWASWCGPCRLEHPILMEIAESGVPIIGVNYKDRAPDAMAFLEELGDPFTRVGVDASGRAGIDWGLYGVPETFVIDGDGNVLLRHPGPILPELFEQKFRPLLEGG